MASGKEILSERDNAVVRDKYTGTRFFVREVKVMIRDAKEPAEIDELCKRFEIVEVADPGK